MPSGQDALPRLRSVVVASDLSSGGARAVARAASLPFVQGASLLILHVIPAGLPASELRLVEAGVSRKLKLAVAAAARRAEASGGRDIEVTAELAIGDAASEIVRRARLASADVLVLGRHSRRPVHDLFLGSTAHRVARKAELPVLLVNSDPTKEWARPIAAVDLGDTSVSTIDIARRILGDGASRLGLVHAFEVSFEGLKGLGLDPDKLTSWGRKFEVAAEQRVSEFLAILGATYPSTVRPGPAAQAIVKEAMRRRADLLVIGTHGRVGLARLLLGSVAERVLATSPCDILVARPVRHDGAPPAPPRQRIVRTTRRTPGRG